jgi:hypothetical protein
MLQSAVPRGREPVPKRREREGACDLEIGEKERGEEGWKRNRGKRREK